MKKVNFSPEYERVWDEFCLQQEEAWFWHTSLWLEFCLESRFGVKTENLSYLLMDDKLQSILAIVPLILEIKGQSREFTFNGGPMPAPVIKAVGKQQKEIEKFIFNEYKEKAVEKAVQRIAIRQGNIFQTKRKFTDPQLIKQGYIDISVYTSVLDLTQSDQQLLAGMTKGHRSAIKKAIRLETKVKFYDKYTITDEKWTEFKNAYFAAAGKQTRPNITFERFFQLIGAGIGYLFESSCQNQSTGFVYVIVCKSYAYYALSCRTLNDTAEGSQVTQWEIIKLLKENKVGYYELGEQYFTPTFFYPVDPKMIAISQHKRGFGGLLLSQNTGEYFFSQQYLTTVWGERYRQFVSCFQELGELKE